MVEERAKLAVEKQLMNILKGKTTCSECFNCPISDCKNSFEEAREIAFRFWDIISEKAPCYMRIEHNYNGEISFFCGNAYIGELETFCNCSYFTKILAKVASNSGLHGKFYVRRAYPLRLIEFSF